MPLQFWSPLACPQCGSQRLRNNGRSSPVASFHACRDCGCSFRALSDRPVLPKADRRQAVQAGRVADS